MAGVKALRRIQLGREGTAGSNAAATTYWTGTGTIQDNMDLRMVKDDSGMMTGRGISYISKYLAGITFDSVEATFEQLPHVLEAGVMAATQAQDGAGSGYIYDYGFPETTQRTPKTYSIEGGDDQQAEEMSYSFVESFTLSGEGGEPWKVQANWLGRQVSTTTFTAGLTYPAALSVMQFSKTKLYIDTIGTYGSTLKSNTLLKAALEVKTGYQPVFTADGQLYFSFVKQTAPEITLKVTFEHNTTGVAEIAAWRAETARSIMLLCEGPALSSAGTTYTYKTMKIALPGKWTAFGKLGEMNGNDILEGTFSSYFDGTAGSGYDAGYITVVNELSALPS